MEMIALYTLGKLHHYGHQLFGCAPSAVPPPGIGTT